MIEIIPAYHFVGDRLRNGQPVPPDGQWLEYQGPLPVILCTRGLHASEHPFDALQYAPGATLCRVELDGTILRDIDKCVATRRRILCRADATALLWAFARRCALDVAHLWECPDVARQYLATGDRTLSTAAWSAARAARNAAGAAAEAAAGAAAWSAARAARNAAGAAARATRAAAGAAAEAAARDAAEQKYRGWFAEVTNVLFHNQ